MDATLSPLTDAERAWLREQLAAAQRFVADYGSTRSIGAEAVQHAWASWLDRQNVDPQDPDPIINAVGVFFGQTLVEGLAGFDWVIASDEAGTDLAVFGLPDAGDVLIYPANIVAERYQARDAWFLTAGLDQVRARVAELRTDPAG